MTLLPAVEDYIAFKRSAGQKYITHAQELRAFGAYLGDVELSSVSTERVFSFLEMKRRSRHTWNRKYSQLKRFFRYCRSFEDSPCIAMPEPRPTKSARFIPHIFSREELRILFRAAGARIHAPNTTVDAESFRLVLLLLYATGGSLREVIGLRTRDVDLIAGTIVLGASTIVARQLPIGLDLQAVIRSYTSARTGEVKGDTPLIRRRSGGKLNEDSVHRLFWTLSRQTGITRWDEQEGRRLRLLDFRATFAVHRIGQAIQHGENLNRLLPALSLYMGYKDLAATEKFLSLTPERFESALRTLSRNESIMRTRHAQ